MNRIPRTFGNQFFINSEKNGKKREFTMKSPRCDTKAARTREILGESEIAWTIGSNVTPFRSLSSAVASLFISLQSSPSCPLFPFAHMCTTTTIFSSIVAVLSSLCLFSVILVTECFLRGSCRVLRLLVHPLDSPCYLKAHATRIAVSCPRDYQRRKKGFYRQTGALLLVADGQNPVAIIIERIEKKFNLATKEKKTECIRCNNIKVCCLLFIKYNLMSSFLVK